jgi:glycosyltransferase involved in cell wall biosynthesis
MINLMDADMAAVRLDFSVIICAYTEERWEDLSGAIKSVQAQISAPREIIVVIDHNPVLFERLRLRAEHSDAGVILIENSQPKGLSGARNSGLAVAQGDVIAFLDDDAVAAPDWLAKLNEGYRHNEVLGVGGAIEPLWLAGRPRWFPAEFDWVVGCTYLGMPLTAQPVRNLIGCNMSFRRELFEGVGGFRNGIGRVGKRPVGCEETELCIRASQNWPEKKFIYDPQAKVQHRIPASRASWAYFRSRCYAEGLSKALITKLVGAEKGLNSERNYTLKTLPGGIGRGISDSLGRSDDSGLGRSGAILTGLAITVFGYIKGKLFNSISSDLSQGQPLQNDGSATANIIPEKLYIEADSTY